MPSHLVKIICSFYFVLETRLLSLKGFGNEFFAKLNILEKDLFSPRWSVRHTKTASQGTVSDFLPGRQELARLGSNSFTKRWDPLFQFDVCFKLSHTLLSDSSVTVERPYFAAQAGYALSHSGFSSFTLVVLTQDSSHSTYVNAGAMVHALRANSNSRLHRHDSRESLTPKEDTLYEELIKGEGRDHLIASETCWQECNNVAFLCPVSTPPCMRNRGENERMIRTRAVRGSRFSYALRDTHTGRILTNTAETNGRAKLWLNDSALCDKLSYPLRSISAWTKYVRFFKNCESLKVRHRTSSRGRKDNFV